jgi:hypothetical protein
MTVNLLQLIPQQPAFMPGKNPIELAKQFLQTRLPKANEVYTRVSFEIRFMDAGENFKSIACPVCGKEISGDWWSAAMDKGQKTKYIDLDIVTPCCTSKTTLNDLTYYFPQGFARFFLAARNPGISEFDEPSQQKLEQILGCKLRVIWPQY